jgi:SAM-dependent methyltransferase
VLYPLTTFLSAFLLFQMQPMVARAILPWFGGSATLWTVAVLFFQFGLLAAYAYAHFVLRALSPSRQKVLHLAVVALSLLTLPVAPSDALKPSGGHEPVLSILVVLFRIVALPYFVVAATAPLLQGWYAQEADSAVRPARLPSPYVLYAVSNTGSLLALLSYPLAIEPVLGLRAQFGAWSVAYGCFAAALTVLAWTRGRGARARVSMPSGVRGAASGDPVSEAQPPPSPAWLALIAALGLAAATNTLLLAVTTTLSHNIAPVPLLWVVPLALYLLSFALPFGIEMRRLRLFLPFVAVLALGPIAYTVTASGRIALPARLGLLMPAFFAICLACHVELAHLKPHPRYLSSFYLMIALGGALGGVFAGVLSPFLFESYHELPLSLVACAVLAVCLFGRSRRWSWRHPLVAVPVAAALAAGVYMAHASIEDLAGDRLATRNFYGTLEVTDDPAPDDMGPFRLLINGSIRHGGQLLDPAHRRDPTTYYGPDSGAGLAVQAAEQGGPIRVGVIGLGTGTLACYGRAGDLYVFYEINPLVVRLASTEFSFLRDSPARIEIVPGDGRLSLERRAGPLFDVLIVDAFSGDSIPVHLLTREAFALYFRRLAPGGILALHISNKYVDLEPVVNAAALALGKRGVVVSTDDEDFPLYDSTWVLLSSRADRFEAPQFKDAEPLTATPVAWTDDYSNLLSVLKR